MRNMVLVSHANPEDNDFTRWIALRLAREGYGVWSDLTKLLGGEVFWDDIEDAIRNRTAKFLYVLSRASNAKPGPRNELAIARTTARAQELRDFVIPLWIDDLPAGDFNVELHRLNAIRFQESWAAGLAQLLEKLAEEEVPKNPAFNPASVSQWWRDHIAGTRIVVAKPERVASNWYPVETATLYFHELALDKIGCLTLPAALPYPGVKHDQYLVSFAPAEDFEGKLGPGVRIARTVSRQLNSTDVDQQPRLWSYRDERRHLTNLLRQAWRALLTARQLATHEFANNAQAFFYHEGQLPEDTIWFPRIESGKGHRQVVGYRTVKGQDGYPKGKRVWHFALEAKPVSKPFIGYVMRSHVLFSDDGKNIWSSKERLQRARRSQCKNWWNDDWRDRVTAMLYSISDSDARIAIPVGSSTSIAIQNVPLLLELPVSYDEEVAVQAYQPFDDDDDIPELDVSGLLNAPNAEQRVTDTAREETI